MLLSTATTAVLSFSSPHSYVCCCCSGPSMSVSTAEVAEPTATTNAAATTPNHQSNQLLLRAASPNVQVLEAAAAAQARHQFDLLFPPAEIAMLSASRSA